MPKSNLRNMVTYQTELSMFFSQRFAREYLEEIADLQKESMDELTAQIEGMLDVEKLIPGAMEQVKKISLASAAITGATAAIISSIHFRRAREPGRSQCNRSRPRRRASSHGIGWLVGLQADIRSQRPNSRNPGQNLQKGVLTAQDKGWLRALPARRPRRRRGTIDKSAIEYTPTRANSKIQMPCRNHVM